MKKILSIVLTLCIALGLTSALAESNFTAGTYEGAGEGFGGELKVQVEVSDSEILKVEITEHAESAGISDGAIEKIPEEIVKNQTVNVDGVSGATFSSEAIKEAVKDALIKAGGAEEYITRAVEKEAKEAGELKTAEYDIIVIGAGGAGMSAAFEAKKAGANVVVLEKTDHVGGNTLLAGSAMNAADPARQKNYTMGQSEIDNIEELLKLEPENELMKSWQDEVAKDMENYKANGETYLYDSPALHKLQTYAGGDFVADPALVDILCGKALESVNYLEENGAVWKDGVTTAVGAKWMRSHNPTLDLGTAGASFVLPQAKGYEKLGGEVLFDHKVEKLEKDENDRVAIVKGAMSDGTPFEYKANKAVLIATGGFGANVEMRQKYNKHWADLGENIATTNVPTATGDGILLAEGVGANLVGMEWIQLIPTSKDSFTAGINNSVFVNKNGERFVREDGRRDELSAAVLKQPGQAFYKVIDTHTTVDELNGITYKGVKIEDRAKEDFVFYGETLEELAEDAGFDKDTFIAAVEDYNAAVEKHEDKFGRQLFDQKIDAGPFYAIQGEVKVHHTMGGININEKTQALDKNGDVIPGLYAAGEVTGGIHGSNRLGGNAITDVITFGRIAGEEMSK